jgi:23S rRNA (uracil1939-C5)-methyltransferase
LDEKETQSPMSVHTIEIESLANGGDGVGRLADGRVAFVPLSAPGDIVRVTIEDDRGSYVRAAIDSIEEASSARAEPPCPYFGVCGGCQWQHVSREAQLEAKTGIVRDALDRIAHVGADTVLSDCEDASSDYGYRNKVELRVGTSAGKLELGFTRRDSNELVPVERCLLMADSYQELLPSVRGALRFLAGRESLDLVRVGLRTAFNTRDVQVALWTTPSPFPRSIAGTTLEQATGANSVVRVISADSAETRSVKNVERLAGKAWWSERLGGLRLSASAPSFFQVNTSAAERLSKLVVEAAAPEESDEVVDLYAGVGTFTIPLAEYAHVAAIESSRWALGDLRHNLERAQVPADVMGGDAAYSISEVHSCDVALVDPPRAGLAESVICDLAGLSPRRIVYVSCDCATLARDVERFGRLGYGLTSVAPIDLFPNTHHVESVAVLEPTA